MIKLLGAIGAFLISVGSQAEPALAQVFPTKQAVKIVVATNAGGSTDALARVTAEFLQRRLGQAVVVENRPGAGGTIGADYVAKSRADGYTILLAGAEQAIAPAVRPQLPYKFENFTFLIRPFTNDTLIVASPKFAPNSLKELVEYMKANPGKVRYGSTGVGAIVHLGMAMFEAGADVKAAQIPYTGIAPVYTDLLAGNIDITIGANYPFPSGLKVLGNANSRRSTLYPDAPTLEEAGINGATWGVWFGFLAPPNLPQPIADRLITEIQMVIKDPEAIEKYKTANKLVPEPNPAVGADFKKQALDEVDTWKAVANRLGVVVQE
jgi:tripartite-type tricarboxylate transporter receptor subunit TctC